MLRHRFARVLLVTDGRKLFNGMAACSVCGTALRIVLFITVVLVVSTIFKYPFPVEFSGMGMDGIDDDRDFIIRNAILESEDISWTRPSEKPVTNVALVDKKIIKFVRRIMELEKSLANASHESLSYQQRCQLKQMMTHLKLVKTLFERSVFLMKLADLASHQTDSSPWIAWDQLEPATKELEENIKSLRLRDAKDPPIYICFTRESVMAVSFILMTISGLLLALKVVRWIKKRGFQ